MANESIRQRAALDLIDRLDREIAGDSYHLSRGDLDRLYYKLQDFKRELNEIYAKRLAGLNVEAEQNGR